MQGSGFRVQGFQNPLEKECGLNYTVKFKAYSFTRGLGLSGRRGFSCVSWDFQVSGRWFKRFS